MVVFRLVNLRSVLRGLGLGAGGIAWSVVIAGNDRVHWVESILFIGKVDAEGSRHRALAFDFCWHLIISIELVSMS